MPLLVALMYNLRGDKPPGPDQPPDAFDELDSEPTIRAITDALTALGHRVVRIEGDEDAYPRLRQVRPDIVFNLCEGRRGEAREAQIPALLELLALPYTGSGPLALALSLDKPAAKKHFCYHGIPTPRFLAIAPGDPVDTAGLPLPVFVKPVHEGSSMGIGPGSLCRTASEVADRVRYLHRLYRQPALVEAFLAGREFTVGFVGNRDARRTLPVLELDFAAVAADHSPIYSRDLKRQCQAGALVRCPASLAPALERRLVETAAAAMDALGCRDVGRVDLRLDGGGTPNVLEVNPLPGLTPGYSDLCHMAAAAGMPYVTLIGSILAAAAARYGLQGALP